MPLTVRGQQVEAILYPGVAAGTEGESRTEWLRVVLQHPFMPHLSTSLQALHTGNVDAISLLECLHLHVIMSYVLSIAVVLGR